jgi:cytosine deaminase
LADLLLTDAVLDDGSAVDVAIDGERIAAVGPGLTSGRGVRIDLAGQLLLPAPAEPHAHLDKALTAHRVRNPTGDLPGAIDAWLAHRPTIGHDDYVERATAAAELLLANGCTAIRTHVDLGGDIGTAGLEALLEVRAALAGRVAIQTVGLIHGLTGPGGAEQLAVSRAALDLGIDVVGGVPHIEDDPARAVDLALELAGEHGRPIDLHADENLRPDSNDLATLADRVLATGFEHRVTASHCVSLGLADEARQVEVAERCVEAGIAVVTLPHTNLYLQARDRAVATPRGLTAVAALERAGVTVAGGADNLRDPFNPVGRGDPLETASLLVLAAHRTPARAWQMVSEAARAAMGLEPVRIEPGGPAELVALSAGSVGEAVAAGPGGRLVVHRGRVVSGGGL